MSHFGVLDPDLRELFQGFLAPGDFQEHPENPNLELWIQGELFQGFFGVFAHSFV